MVYFSVIIPLFNKAENIRDTLLSVVHQTCRSFEIIIVDDGSEDDGVAIIEQMPDYIALHEDGTAKIQRKSNGGVCSARNMGIQLARYEYIALLDADDLWSPQFLEEMTRLIEDYPDAAIWSSNYAETVNGKIIRNVATGLTTGYRGVVNGYFEMPDRVSDLVCSSSVVIRKPVFDVVGYFDERIRYAEDTDMWWRIISCYPFAFMDKYLVFYQFDAENRAQKTYRRLDVFLPYYIDKYREERFKSNQVFYRYSNRWASVCLREYYFSKRQDERLLAKEAVSKLDYSVIPVKYKYLYGSIFPVGWILNKLDKIYQKLK